MRFFFHPEAEEELGKAVEYYEKRRTGLGMELAGEVYAAIARIIEYPEAWTPLSKNTRRCIVNRFPYGVIYRVKGGTVEVVAVAGLRQRPGYWEERVREG